MPLVLLLHLLCFVSGLSESQASAAKLLLFLRLFPPERVPHRFLLNPELLNHFTDIVLQFFNLVSPL
jgi:hypothetical protein